MIMLSVHSAASPPGRNLLNVNGDCNYYPMQINMQLNIILTHVEQDGELLKKRTSTNERQIQSSAFCSGTAGLP